MAVDDFRTYKRKVTGENDLANAVRELVKWSAWFSVMPLPDDEYELSVREENSERLNWLVDFML